MKNWVDGWAQTVDTTNHNAEGVIPRQLSLERININVAFLLNSDRNTAEYTLAKNIQVLIF